MYTSMAVQVTVSQGYEMSVAKWNGNLSSFIANTKYVVTLDDTVHWFMHACNIDALTATIER